MLKLDEFNLDRKKDSYEIFLYIKNFIDQYSSDKSHLENIDYLSSFFNIPKSVIELKFKRLVYNQFNFDECKFNNINNFFFIFINFFKFLISFLFIIFIGATKKKINNYKIIIDDIDNLRQIKKFSKLMSLYNSCLVITNSEKIKKKINGLNGIKVINPKKLLPIKMISNKSNTSFFNFILKTFIFSFKKKQNFIYFYYYILLSVIKNETLFCQFKSNYMIYDRFYKSCPIKNFIFKKYGGKFNFCAQYHLVESGISLYNDIDIFLTFGKEKNSEKKIKIFGGNVNESISIGSISMESEYFNCDKKNELNEIDLLIIGINPSHWIKISKKIERDYYKYLEWIVSFSKENPDTKIIYKHHSSFKEDKIERKIFKNSNIKIISNDPKNNSYFYLSKCKIAVSYGSTMVLEGIGLNKNCFFVDPNKSASTFYKDHHFDEGLFLNSYEEFSKTIKKFTQNKNENSIYNDKICLDSSETTERINTIIDRKTQTLL